MNTSLIHTERKLVTIFLSWALLFLLVFEGFFLVSRYVFEENMSRNWFLSEMKRMENQQEMSGGSPRRGKDFGPRIGMSVISIDKSWAIINERWFEEMFEWESPISMEDLQSLDVWRVTKKDGILLYKRIRPENPNEQIIFLRKSGYPIEDLLRDILRFIILDILIVVPFYFMGRYFVRKTLEPVEENMSAMSHFIHNAGHELKTPLAIISGNLQILRESNKPDSTLVEESIKTIHDMSDALDGLLELSNLKKWEKIETLNILDAFREEITKEKSEITKKQLEVIIEIPQDETVIMDRRHFSLLFWNLLRNAILYNKTRGEIRISYSDNTISVKDSGIGIEEKNLKKIWDRFYRVEKSGINPGSGIGLSIVEKIASLYHWKIDVASKIGEGTTFRVGIK
jgi:signal transduction histidine kinase